MTHLFFRFILLWSISVGIVWAWVPWPLSCLKNADDIEKSLKLANFKCQPKSINNCTYTECTGFLPSYPKPILVAIPALAEGLRLHFHGHKLGTYPEYERNLSSMVKSFGLNAELCKSNEVTVFPESDGKCATYDEKLKTKLDFERFLKEFHSVTGQTLKDSTLSLSAHSGGGRTVSRFLDSGLPVGQVTIFDGIYADYQKNSLKNWYQKGEGKLILASVKGMSPDSFSETLKKELGVKLNVSKATIQGTSYDVSRGGRLVHYSREAGPGGALKAHYDVLSQTWPASH